MKFIFNIAAAACVAASVACHPAAPPRVAQTSDGGDVQRLVGVLDYLAADYGRAVEKGTVVNPDEYVEQIRFTEDGHALLRGLLQGRDDEAARALLRDMEEAAQAVAQKADADEVAARCRSLRNAVVEQFGLRTAPAGRPVRARGAQLFAESCATCHGARGYADTERARGLSPQPANYHDPEVRAKLSPYRAYSALTFGVSGTAMPSFEALSAEDRWSLAFIVLSLAHEDGGTTPMTASMPLSDLAWLNDTELTEELRAQGHRAPPRGLVHLRTVAPFEEPSVAAGIKETRARLERAASAYAAGARLEAERLVLDAYLQGFEPLEARLRARDPQMTASVERAFGTLRSAMRNGDDPLTVRTLTAAVAHEMAPLSESGGVLPFVAAFIIYFREGVEAALLVGALLAAVRKMGERHAARDIHYGWMAALPAGLATWWAFARLVNLGYAERELIEAGTALLAAAVLFLVSFWLISKAESRRWIDYLKRSVTVSLERRSRIVLASMAFLAVYREAAETILFTQALLMEAVGSAAQVWMGAAAGLAAVTVMALLMRRAVMALPIGPFFAVSSVLLCLLAVSFAGSGLYKLISAGYVTPRPVPFPELPWIGVHPDLSVLALQSTILLVIAIAGIVTLRRSQAEPRT
jgi:high-affinity iron transporter